MRLFQYRELLVELVKRDLKIKYRRSVLGILWSVLNPLLFMCVTTLIFSTVFKSDIAVFPVYFLTGLLIYNLYAESTGLAQVSVIGNASLIKKVKLQVTIFPISKICFSFFNTLFSLIALIIVMVALWYIPPITAIFFFIPIIFVFLFSIGVGLFLAALAVFFRDTLHLYGVFLTVLSYFSAIFYPESIIPANYRHLLLLNPVYAFIKYFRMLMLDGVFPSLEYNLLCCMYCLISLGVGYYYFEKKKHKFILYV